VRHIRAIAGRELGAYFTSPVAYAVLVLFTLMAGFFFLLHVESFLQASSFYDAQWQMEAPPDLNINDWVLSGYYQMLLLLFWFLVPGLTMGLFANEKAQGTQELLMTSPITTWELVLGKYLAVAALVTLFTVAVALLTTLLFVAGNPEAPRALTGLLGLWLLGLAYAAIGSFASSTTQSPLIAFLLGWFLLMILWVVGFVASILGGAGAGTPPALVDVLRWLSSQHHYEQLVSGLLDTRALAYFGFMIALFLLLTKASVESLRWR